MEELQDVQQILALVLMAAGGEVEVTEKMIIDVTTRQYSIGMQMVGDGSIRVNVEEVNVSE